MGRHADMEYVDIKIFKNEFEGLGLDDSDKSIATITVRKQVIYAWFKENILKKMGEDIPVVSDEALFGAWLKDHTPEQTKGLLYYTQIRDGLGFKLHARVTRQLIVSYDQMERLNNLLTGCIEHCEIDDIRSEFTKGIDSGGYEEGYIPLDWAKYDIEDQFNPNIYAEYAYTGIDLDLAD